MVLSKSILAIWILVIYCSCNKENIEPSNSAQTLNISGRWYLQSVFFPGLNESEQLNNFYESYNFSYMTSCSTQLSLHDSSALYFETLYLLSYFDCEAYYVEKYIDLDSTYSTCIPQYQLDSMSYKLNGTCKIDSQSFSITYIYHYSPGGSPYYTTQTYSVIDWTDSTMKVSGPFPIGDFIGQNIATFSFSR